MFVNIKLSFTITFRYSNTASAVEGLVAVLTLTRGSRAGSSKGGGETGSRELTWPERPDVRHLTAPIAMTLISAVSVTLAA